MALGKRVQSKFRESRSQSEIVSRKLLEMFVKLSGSESDRIALTGGYYRVDGKWNSKRVS